MNDAYKTLGWYTAAVLTVIVLIVITPFNLATDYYSFSEL